MKRIVGFLVMVGIVSCNTGGPVSDSKEKANKMNGTWQLVTGTTIQGNDTVRTEYTKGRKFVKIINGTHFSFVAHDLTRGKDSIPFYSSGAGTYTLSDSVYTEHLEFCSDRAWEGNNFSFTVSINGDSLTQTGIEKVEKLGINRLNVERYIRVR